MFRKDDGEFLERSTNSGITSISARNPIQDAMSIHAVSSSGCSIFDHSVRIRVSYNYLYLLMSVHNSILVPR